MQNYKHELIDFVLMPKTKGWKLLFLEMCHVRKKCLISVTSGSNTFKIFAWYLLKIAFSLNLAWTQNLLHNIKGIVQRDGSGEVVQYVISKVEALRYLAKIFTSLIIVLYCIVRYCATATLSGIWPKHVARTWFETILFIRNGYHL
jgi:hypothetical protein